MDKSMTSLGFVQYLDKSGYIRQTGGTGYISRTRV